MVEDEGEFGQLRAILQGWDDAVRAPERVPSTGS
jgi:hypothetical protein